MNQLEKDQNCLHLYLIHVYQDRCVQDELLFKKINIFCCSSDLISDLSCTFC